MKFKEPASRVGVPKLPVTSALPQKYVDEYKVILHVVFSFCEFWEAYPNLAQEEMDIDLEVVPMALDETNFAEGSSVSLFLNC